MIIMSVDLGKARTGIAISDISESFAFPKAVIKEHNTYRLVEKISALAKEYCAELIVVGLPKNMDGSEGERAAECKEIGEMIENQSCVKVALWDERCTTISAHTALNYTNTRGQKRKNVVDAVAATIILEDYLSFRKNKGI